MSWALAPEGISNEVIWCPAPRAGCPRVPRIWAPGTEPTPLRAFPNPYSPIPNPCPSQCPRSSKYFSASSAAMHPDPAAVIACR